MQVSDAVEWSEVLRRESVHVRQDGDLELNSVRHRRPVETVIRILWATAALMPPKGQNVFVPPDLAYTQSLASYHSHANTSSREPKS